MLKAFWISIVAVALLAIGAYSVMSSATGSNSGVSTSTIAAETDVYSIDVAYPKFGNAKADSVVQAIVDKAVADLKEFPPLDIPVPYKNELVGEYSHTYIGEDILSARMNIYQFTGGAHGITAPYGLNFHADGTPYTLDEALSLIGKDLKQVSIEAIDQLTRRFGMVQFPEGATPTPEHYGTFVIGKDTVTFVFHQYQVEAYAAGMPEIEFARIK